MKLLRFRYIVPASIFMVVVSMMIVYAKINWDADLEGVWYGPNNPPYTDDTASFTTDRADFDSYSCPPPPLPPVGPGGPGGPGPGGPDPTVTPPYIPPAVTGNSSDSF